MAKMKLSAQIRSEQRGTAEPMWTNENRARYDRSALRYPSDVTDKEWAQIKVKCAS